MKPLTYILIFLLALTIALSVFIVNFHDAIHILEAMTYRKHIELFEQLTSSQAEEIASLTAQIEQGQEIGQELTLQPLGEFEVTHYNINSGTGDGITKSGTKVLEGRTVAVCPEQIPLGSLIYIQDVGFRIAEDIGAGIDEFELDLYVDKTTEECYELGRLKNIKVWIIESEGK
jgi:3D (Asp-Asp-Asp) domain-containing protein